MGDLTPLTINLIAIDIEAGEADPHDAERLLELFRDCIDAREPLPPRLIKHLRDAFDAYLNGRRSIEASLGLKRRKGSPKASEQRRMELAGEVLRRRIEDDMTYQDAVASVSEKFNVAESLVGVACKDHRLDAIAWFKLNREPAGSPWTHKEKQRLCHIFGGKKDREWFIHDNS